MIRFPRNHIATSVTNRILNVADELESNLKQPQAPTSASVPSMAGDPSAQSVALDQALATPLGELPPIEQTADPGATAGGKPLLATMLDPQ